MLAVVHDKFFFIKNGKMSAAASNFFFSLLYLNFKKNATYFDYFNWKQKEKWRKNN